MQMCAKYRPKPKFKYTSFDEKKKIPYRNLMNIRIYVYFIYEKNHKILDQFKINIYYY